MQAGQKTVSRLTRQQTEVAGCVGTVSAGAFLLSPIYDRLCFVAQGWEILPTGDTDGWTSEKSHSRESPLRSAPRFR